MVAVLFGGAMNFSDQQLQTFWDRLFASARDAVCDCSIENKEIILRRALELQKRSEMESVKGLMNLTDRNAIEFAIEELLNERL